MSAATKQSVAAHLNAIASLPLAMTKRSRGALSFARGDKGGRYRSDGG
jgi:hypothetical protein